MDGYSKYGSRIALDKALFISKEIFELASFKTKQEIINITGKNDICKPAVWNKIEMLL